MPVEITFIFHFSAVLLFFLMLATALTLMMFNGFFFIFIILVSTDKRFLLLLEQLINKGQAIIILRKITIAIWSCTKILRIGQ